MSFRDFPRNEARGEQVKSSGEDRRDQGVVTSKTIPNEVVTKAIQLLREGRIRNPNDLVIELGLDLDSAENCVREVCEEREDFRCRCGRGSEGGEGDHS